MYFARFFLRQRLLLLRTDGRVTDVFGDQRTAQKQNSMTSMDDVDEMLHIRFWFCLFVADVGLQFSIAALYVRSYSSTASKRDDGYAIRPDLNLGDPQAVR
jgi:hypothetical protein